jgi:Raf kinase inhibitor-like YbhB/YbcL family protein
MRKSSLACFWISAFLAGCGDSSPQTQGLPAMKLTSTAFTEGSTIPKKFTGDGEDHSPPLQWSEVPDKTKSFALIADDPDAPMGTWVHWVIFNLPAYQHELAEGVPPEATLASGAKQGKNDFKKIGYGGPAPPKGKPHRYYFKLYALDSMLELNEGASKKDVERAMKGHILASGELMGLYGR